MNKIRVLRKESRYTQNEVADALGVAQNTYSQWENGITEPSIEMLMKIADRYGVSVDYVIGYSDSRELNVPEYLRLLSDYFNSKYDTFYAEKTLIEIDNVIDKIVKLKIK